MGFAAVRPERMGRQARGDCRGLTGCDRHRTRAGAAAQRPVGGRRADPAVAGGLLSLRGRALRCPGRGDGGADAPVLAGVCRPIRPVGGPGARLTNRPTRGGFQGRAGCSCSAVLLGGAQARKAAALISQPAATQLAIQAAITAPISNHFMIVLLTTLALPVQAIDVRTTGLKFRCCSAEEQYGWG
uniref:Hypothethical protein n=1 Tax=Ralstonia solanacearum TaxID=305 RepID=A0A0S4VIG4_RALSL|nr:Hypothethical protein [Ralstonia solanacearum]CUV31507.1 Hypothethical protein [Ralstonia solanacearum]CUV34392.1 Hypothethical protein [Ralstonia solanacearum]CUV39684.1 Hypothethical protein [Ralstonia solanacearum]CUV54248.1 Hypothethical protein [Ralstonia solanacearum]